MSVRLCLAICLAFVAVAQAEVCRNTLDDSFFNKCRRETDPGIWAGIATTINSFVNPRTLAIICTAFVLALPCVFLLGQRQLSVLLKSDQLGSVVYYFKAVHILSLNFLHRVCYTLTLSVALYCVFRQHRPCECASSPSGPFVQVGSIYGMPSGDAMSGTVTGMLLILWAPASVKKRMTLVAVLIAIAKCAERMVLGYHTMGQVITGSSLGVLLSLYSEFAPQYFIFVDVFVQFMLGSIVFAMDKSVVYRLNDTNNLVAWFTWGAAFNIFVTILMYRFFHLRRWVGAELSLRKLLELLRTESEPITEVSMRRPHSFSQLQDTDDGMLRAPSPHTLLINDTVTKNLDALEKEDLLYRASDVSFTFGSVMVLVLLVFIANLFQVYAWGVKA